MNQIKKFREFTRLMAVDEKEDSKNKLSHIQKTDNMKSKTGLENWAAIKAYELQPISWQELDLPKNAEILKVKSTKGKIILFALGKEYYGTRKVAIEMFATNTPITSGTMGNRKYIGSVNVRKHNFHIFEYVG